MLTDNEKPVINLWGGHVESDPRCEECGRSVVARFGGEPYPECDSCAHSFILLHKAEKLVMDGWVMEVKKMEPRPGDPPG